MVNIRGSSGQSDVHVEDGDELLEVVQEAELCCDDQVLGLFDFDDVETGAASTAGGGTTTAAENCFERRLDLARLAMLEDEHLRRELVGPHTDVAIVERIRHEFRRAV